MCYLIEKYAPLDGIDPYDPQIDPSITGARIVPHLPESNDQEMMLAEKQRQGRLDGQNMYQTNRPMYGF